MGTFLAGMVFLPGLLGIGLPGDLPQFTVQRILLLVAWFFLGRSGYLSGRAEPIPYLRWLLFFGLVQVVSFAGGVARLAGFKECIDYAFEAVLFFTLVTAYLQRDGSPVRLLSSLCHGLAAVGVVAALQKYFRLGPVPYAAPESLLLWLDRSDISSTYPHRILFGYAMAMGVPVALGLACTAIEPARRRRMYAIGVVLIAADYFSNSRGPWLGLALGLVAMAALGGGAVRRRLLVVAALAAAVLVLRPGVRDTISDLASSTFEDDSLKGASYQFRWQLWHVAWSEIRLSPERFLFGYGPVSTEGMDFTDYWQGQEGSTSSMEKLGHTSWDNNYAANLIELGVTGFALQLILFAAIIRRLLRGWRQADPETRMLRAGIASACLVFMFAMTNVFIFSPQLKYLFWALVAIGSNLSWAARAPSPEEAEALPAASDEARRDQPVADRGLVHRGGAENAET